MFGKTYPGGPELEALFDQREHLQIQISLAIDSERPDAEELNALHKRLLQIEDIARRWRDHGGT